MGLENDRNDVFQGVSVIKSIDAKLWSERHEKQTQKISTGTTSNSCFGQKAKSASTEFNYDWTKTFGHTHNFKALLSTFVLICNCESRHTKNSPHLGQYANL